MTKLLKRQTMSLPYTQYSLSEPMTYHFEELFSELFNKIIAHASFWGVFFLFLKIRVTSEQNPSPCPLVHDKETSDTILASTGEICLHKARTQHQGPGREGGLTCGWGTRQGHYSKGQEDKKGLTCRCAQSKETTARTRKKRCRWSARQGHSTKDQKEKKDCPVCKVQGKNTTHQEPGREGGLICRWGAK